MLQTSSMPTASGFELRYQSLFREGRALAFACDPEGHVDIDALSERARNNYLFARASIGLEYALPVVKVSKPMPTVSGGAKAASYCLASASGNSGA